MIARLREEIVRTSLSRARGVNRSDRSAPRTGEPRQCTPRGTRCSLGNGPTISRKRFGAARIGADLRECCALAWDARALSLHMTLPHARDCPMLNVTRENGQFAVNHFPRISLAPSCCRAAPSTHPPSSPCHCYTCVWAGYSSGEGTRYRELGRLKSIFLLGNYFGGVMCFCTL